MDTHKTQAAVDLLTSEVFEERQMPPCPKCGAIIDERLAGIDAPYCYPCRMGNRRQPLYRTGD